LAAPAHLGQRDGGRVPCGQGCQVSPLTVTTCPGSWSFLHDWWPAEGFGTSPRPPSGCIASPAAC
jgi:hypothetical protein